MVMALTHDASLCSIFMDRPMLKPRSFLSFSIVLETLQTNCSWLDTKLVPISVSRNRDAVEDLESKLTKVFFKIMKS
jgi:hypothetical protein